MAKKTRTSGMNFINAKILSNKIIKHTVYNKAILNFIPYGKLS
jgi:hypothetical protein